MFLEMQRRNYWSWMWRLQGFSLMDWSFPAMGAWLGSAGPPQMALGMHGLLPKARWAQCTEQAMAVDIPVSNGGLPMAMSTWVLIRAHVPIGSESLASVEVSHKR